MSDIDFGRDTEVRENEPLSRHSSFRIGGNARYAVLPRSCDELVYALNVCKQRKIRFMVVGNASNLLFDDNGYDGAVIFTGGINAVEYIYKNGETYIKAECGKLLTELANEVGKKHSLSGFEFAYGIPGTVGGAVYMNAGAYGGQMSDIIEETAYFNADNGEISVVNRADQNFSYRHSIFQEHSEYTILSTTIKLCGGNAEDIFNKMSKYMSARKEKQPLEYPSAGSVFKRPGDNIFAGKLIEDSGLKGYTVGGAQVSEKHAGFIVNRGGATAKNVTELIEHIKHTVMQGYGIELECEIISVPYN